MREAKCTKRGVWKVGPGVRIKCLGSSLHSGSICGKNGSPFLPLMGLSHRPECASFRIKGKMAGFSTRRTRPTKIAKMLGKIRTDLRTVDGGGNFQTSHVQMTYSQEVFRRWVQSDLCNSVEVSAGIRQEEWPGSSDR